MKEKIRKNKGLKFLLAIIMIIIAIVMPVSNNTQSVTAEAKTMNTKTTKAVKYMKVNTFIKHLVQTSGLEVDISVKTPYIAAAIKAGILKDGEFADFNSYITRMDAAVLINRADEYLHEDAKDAINKELLSLIQNKRISDIKQIPEEKREDVAKVFAKGIIKGYSNGKYTQGRAFKGNDKITAAAAMSAIRLVTNISGRAKMSPDGQLIRTTNLPKNADKYEYILASFPNKFYEKKFEFQYYTQFKDGALSKDDYCYPKNMKNWTFKTWYKEWAFSKEMDKYLYDWQEKAETYLNYVFNVDYRTVNDKWIEGLSSCFEESNLDYPEVIQRRYIDEIKKNKVIVESSLISVEPSSLYFDDGYCMRAYVRYRITAKDINVEQSDLIFCTNPYLLNLKNGKWRIGYFDIRFGTNDGSNGDGSEFAIEYTTWFGDEE